MADVTWSEVAREVTFSLPRGVPRPHPRISRSPTLGTIGPRCEHFFQFESLFVAPKGCCIPFKPVNLLEEGFAGRFLADDL